MYNNLGLSSVKGKGTSGYIQSSRILQQTKKKQEHVGSEYYNQTKPKRNEYKDNSIIEHELRRKIEVNILEYIEQHYKDIPIELKKEKIKQKRLEINKLIEEKQSTINTNKEREQRQSKYCSRSQRNHQKSSLLSILEEFANKEIKED